MPETTQIQLEIDKMHQHHLPSGARLWWGISLAVRLVLAKTSPSDQVALQHRQASKKPSMVCSAYIETN
jgi:hypothetical protein